MKMQMVILATFDGTCADTEMLKQVWEQRVKKHFPHYEVVQCLVKKV